MATVSFFIDLVVSTFTNELSIARESATKMLSELEKEAVSESIVDSVEFSEDSFSFFVAISLSWCYTIRVKHNLIFSL